MDTAFVFSGSGFLMYAHLGAAQCLYDKNMRPDIVVGTSGGSIVAAFLATGKEPKDALEISKKILPKSFIKFNGMFYAKNHWGFFTLDGLEKVIKPYIPIKFCDSKLSLHVVTTNTSIGKTFVFSPESTPSFEVAKAVRASCSIPVIFEPMYQKECDMLYTDGGSTNNLAVDLDVVKKAKRVYAIRLFSGDDNVKKPESFVDYLFNTLGCMMHEIERKHIEDASEFAKIITIHVPFNGMNFLAIDEKKIQWMYDVGYATMEQKIKDGKVLV